MDVGASLLLKIVLDFFRIYVLINMTLFTCKSVATQLTFSFGAVTVLNNFDRWTVKIMFDDFGTDGF